MPSRTVRICTLLLAAALGHQTVSAAEIAPEPMGQVAKLPAQYPSHWLIVHDLAFSHMREGKLFIVDPALPSGRQVRGILSADFIASYLASGSRNELYVIESFHSRGGRGGERTDVVTVYDPATLDVAAEIEVPPKRLTGVPNLYQAMLTRDGRFLLIYNFTPSQSVSVVDLEARRFVGEVPIPGCAYVYPTADRAFTSICSDGSLRSVRLTADGAMEGSDRVAPFIDVENDAMMEKPALIDGVGYFPTFTGNVIPIDLSGRVARVGKVWSLTTDAERAEGWRPGGGWPAAADPAGRMYVLMHGHGAEGTHKDGGDEVWVFDAAKGQRVDRFKLREWGLAVAVSAAEPPALVVTGATGAIDLYRLDGEHTQTLGIETEFPFFVHSVR